MLKSFAEEEGEKGHLDLLSDPSMEQFFTRGIRGGQVLYLKDMLKEKMIQKKLDNICYMLMVKILNYLYEFNLHFIIFSSQ